MKKLIAYSVLSGLTFGVLLLIICFMTGCRVAKVSRTERYVTVSKDSARHDSATHLREREQVISTKETKDSTVGVAGTTITYSGDADTVIKAGNLWLRYSTDSRGKKRVECTSDSLTLVVRSLVRENTLLKHSKDSVSSTAAYRDRQSDVTTTLKEVVEKGNAGFWAFLREVAEFIAGFVVGVIYTRWIHPAIVKFYKWQISTK